MTAMLTIDQQKLQTTANKFLGRPYLWDGKDCATGGLDCSGFLSCVYASIGITLGAGTAGELQDAILGRNGARFILEPGEYTNWPYVESRLQFADLVLANNGGHVTLYANDGMIYEEPNSNSVCHLVPAWIGTPAWPVYAVIRYLPNDPVIPPTPVVPPVWPGRVLELTTPLMSGADVTTWQELLVKKLYPVTVDGDYGPLTAHATGLLQVACGFVGAWVDSKVGPATWKRAFA